MKLKLLIVTALFLIISCNAWAATTYYVKTGGDDTAAGTSSTYNRGAAWDIGAY